MNQLTAKILMLYGIRPAKIYPPQKGYRNSSFKIKTATGRFLNLILYKKEKNIVSRIKKANRIGDFLAVQGLPARQVYKSQGPKIIEIKTATGARYTCLYHYLPGQTIPWEAYTQKHLKILGKTMSEMHYFLKKMPRQTAPNFLLEYLSLIDQIETYFSDAGVQRAARQKLGLSLNFNQPTFWKNYKNLFNRLNKQPQQVLHLDFVRSNILFQHTGKKKTPHLSGVIDFEKALCGPRILDIARTLSFLAVDCKYKKPDKVYKYFLKSGYHKRGRMSLPDLTFLNPLMNFFWLYDFYKFLAYNTYETLPENEHFQRTKKVLEQKVLSSQFVISN